MAHTDTTPTHLTPKRGPGRDAALRWLASQLRWERLLAELREPAAGPSPRERHDEEEEAA